LSNRTDHVAVSNPAKEMLSIEQADLGGEGDTVVVVRVLKRLISRPGASVPTSDSNPAACQVPPGAH
jgi:hypothetical protein